MAQKSPLTIKFPLKEGELGCNNRGNEGSTMEGKIREWQCNIEYERTDGQN